MPRGDRLWLCVILFGSLLFAGCQKDDVFCTYENEFCSNILQGEFEQSSGYMDLYLNGLDYEADFVNNHQAHEEKINKLQKWLDCKYCIQSVEILCVSCIYTDPPQSELGIEYNTDDGVVYKVMDIKMSKPMEFARFHE